MTKFLEALEVQLDPARRIKAIPPKIMDAQIILRYVELPIFAFLNPWRLKNKCQRNCRIIYRNCGTKELNRNASR